MIRINLLPYREKEKKEGVARQIVILAGTFILFLVRLQMVLDKTCQKLRDGFGTHINVSCFFSKHQKVVC
jgi:hypothetical protein